MKVIFLDIDGVLNSASTPNPRSFPYIVDDSPLGRFRELVRKTGATVVLSSTWRVDPVGRLRPFQPVTCVADCGSAQLAVPDRGFFKFRPAWAPFGQHGSG